MIRATQLICDKCSTYRAKLEYMGNREEQRVCKQCKSILLKRAAAPAVGSRSIAATSNADGAGVPMRANNPRDRDARPPSIGALASLTAAQVSATAMGGDRSNIDTNQPGAGPSVSGPCSLGTTNATGALAPRLSSGNTSLGGARATGAAAPNGSGAAAGTVPASPTTPGASSDTSGGDGVLRAGEVEGLDVGRAKWRHANDRSALISDYAQISGDNGKKWEKRWLVVHRDYALYAYRAHAVRSHRF